MVCLLFLSQYFNGNHRHCILRNLIFRLKANINIVWTFFSFFYRIDDSILCIFSFFVLLHAWFTVSFWSVQYYNKMQRIYISYYTIYSTHFDIELNCFSIFCCCCHCYFLFSESEQFIFHNTSLCGCCIHEISRLLDYE